ncbi:MAG: response regulator [Nitrospira sp.]|nr:response regulator [Nitrospira sp.]
MSILIIDDSEDQRDLLHAILQRAGFGPLMTVGSPREGLQMLGVGRRGKPANAIDLVLLDLEMPEMTGFEACQQIRLEEHLQGLPIIIITAHTAAEDIQAAYTAGATDYIRKPVIPAELLARVATALSLKQEIDARKLREQELLERTKELDRAFEHITTRHGTIQICAKCKRVNSEGSFWQRIEDYLRRQAHSTVKEAVCDTCLHQAYPHLKQIP